MNATDDGASEPRNQAEASFWHRAVYGSTSNTLVQFGRYLLVGGGAFLVDFGLLALLHYGAGLGYLTASGIGFTTGLVVNYLISVAWVFEVRQVDRRWVEFAVYAIIGVIGLAINQLVIWAFTEHVVSNPLISKGVAAGVVLGWNFSARKLILF